MTKRIIVEETYLMSEFMHARRRQLKISMAELARRAGCSYITIINFENCEANPSWAMVRKILKALNTTLAEYAAWERGILNE